MRLFAPFFGTLAISGVFLMVSPPLLSAHGLIENPPSRNWICGKETQPDQVLNGTAKQPACSTAFALNPVAAYNYMSVVTHTWGRAKLDPLPKNVCGFDGEYWKGAKTPWDVAMSWPANPMKAGPQPFTWNISWGPHFDDTKEFRYWITRADFVFNPAKELAWSDFETEAFCVQEYDDKRPTANTNVVADKAKSLFTTTCNMPARSGHHVIYGEWGRTEPTIERFHGCVDAAFGGTAGTLAKPKPSAKGIRPLSPAGKRSDLLGRIRKGGAAATPLKTAP